MAGKFCTNCGASLNETAKFCVLCGFRIQPQQADPAPAPVTLKQRAGNRWRELGIPEAVTSLVHVEEDCNKQGAVGIVNRGMFLFTYKNLVEGVHTFLYMGTSQDEALQALEQAVLEIKVEAPAVVKPVVPDTAFTLPDLSDLPAPMPLAGTEKAPADENERTLESPDVTRPIGFSMIDDPVIEKPADIPMPEIDETVMAKTVDIPLPVIDEPVIAEPVDIPLPVIDEPAVAEPVDIPLPVIDEPAVAEPVDIPLPVIDEPAVVEPVDIPLPEIDEPAVTEDIDLPLPKLDDLLQMLENGTLKEPTIAEPSVQEAQPITEPHTIEELSAWYKASGLPPYEESGFYIGDTDLLSVYGIRADGDQFEVYRNKHDGTRKVFYRGSDEASAVNGFYNTIRQRMGLADASEFTARKAIEN